MVKVYNNAKITFLLTADDGTIKRVPHSSFAEIEDKFLDDITYRRALETGAFTTFDTAKQGDAAERSANSGKSRSRKAASETQPEDSAETSDKAKQ